MVSAVARSAKKTASGTKRPRQARRRPEAFFRGGISHMTSKGQVTVTANLREALALKPGDRVMMMLQDDGSVRLERLKTPAEFLESLPLRRVKPMSAADLDKLAQVELAKAGVKGVGSKRHH